MKWDRKTYRWYYDHIESRYYDLMITYAFSPFGGEKKVRSRLLNIVAIGPGERILDMCCGTGNNTYEIRRAVGNESFVVGIDLSFGQIRIARSKKSLPSVHLLVTDAANTSFRDGGFDRVVIPHALHEMERGTRIRVLGEAHRLLRKGGRLAVLEMDTPRNPLLRLFIGLWWFYWLPFNFETPTRRDMLRQGLDNELREAGFVNVTKEAVFWGVFQVVCGEKRTDYL